VPILNHVVTMDKGFLDCLHLWTTEEPYSSDPCSTINNSLIPAFMNEQYLLWHDPRGHVRGFITWGWMTNEEFETCDFNGWEVFARRSGDKLVITDMIAPRGSSDVVSISRDARRFFKERFPEVSTIWAHRRDRYGWFPNKG